jgi:hypothetical protein
LVCGSRSTEDDGLDQAFPAKPVALDFLGRQGLVDIRDLDFETGTFESAGVVAPVTANMIALAESGKAIPRGGDGRIFIRRRELLTLESWNL